MPSPGRFVAVITVASLTLLPAAMAQENAGAQGDWSLNRELTPAVARGDSEGRRPVARRPPRGAGGFPGSGGFGGGMPGGRPGPNEKELRTFDAVRRRIEEAPQRLVISIDGKQVQIVDELGRATRLVADGKKQDRVTGDGEFKSITKLDAGRLVVEEDFGGPKMTTTYQRLTRDGESRLQVTLQIDGMPEGHGERDRNAKAPIMRIYDERKQEP